MRYLAKVVYFLKMSPQPETPNFFLVPLDSIPLAVPLPFALYVRVNDNYIKFREKGDPISENRILSLERKIDTVFIEEASWVSFLEYLESVCDVAVEDPQKATRNIHSLLMAYSRHLEQMQVFDQKTVNKLRKVGYKLVELTHTYPETQEKLLRRYKETSIYFSSHSANVAIYSIAIARKLSFPKNQVRELAFACLVHNIGYTMIPKDLLYKKEKLSSKEWEVLQTHVEKGAQLLEYMDCPSEVVATVRQHHEHLDGRGYPHGIKEADIHPFARICTIADVYDALISAKPYGKAPLDPKVAVKEMQSMVGKFDPAILKIL